MPSNRHSKYTSNKSGKLPTVLILVGVLILIAAVFLLKNMQSEPPTSTVSPQARFDQYLSEGKTIFAFFHSYTCLSCTIMMETVDEVYPEFEDEVALVDVDVYYADNQPFLNRMGIKSIPTLVFIDRRGEGEVSIGVMEADQLRQQLVALREEQ